MTFPDRLQCNARLQPTDAGSFPACARIFGACGFRRQVCLSLSARSGCCSALRPIYRNASEQEYVLRTKSSKGINLHKSFPDGRDQAKEKKAERVSSRACGDLMDAPRVRRPPTYSLNRTSKGARKPNTTQILRRYPSTTKTPAHTATFTRRVQRSISTGPTSGTVAVIVPASITGEDRARVGVPPKLRRHS